MAIISCLTSRYSMIKMISTLPILLLLVGWWMEPGYCVSDVDNGFWLFGCNAYKCHCAPYQHRCPDSPWCVNDWDTCNPNKDFCPSSKDNCYDVATCDVSWCESLSLPTEDANHTCVLLGGKKVCLCGDYGLYAPHGVGCSDKQVSPCEQWGACNLGCDWDVRFPDSCTCPEGSVKNDVTGQCAIPTTQESVKVVGVDGFDLRAWTVGSMSRVSDVGFSIRSSSDDTVVSLAASPTRQMVFYAHNPGRLERYGKLFAHSFADNPWVARPLGNVYFKDAGQMAYDWIADNLYLVDKALGQILVISGPHYDQSSTVVAHELFHPSGVAVDPIEKQIA
ncbi:low-density lipoprotein receptor-related protein 2-like [Symsagittifera roscoffensis]|uniref:low-density lipoprotein receptor-related protein 2-like n=1 Tax=Symsagittifera roscoffensis TaxID=84072 RepID=UPI00307C5BB2